MDRRVADGSQSPFGKGPLSQTAFWGNANAILRRWLVLCQLLWALPVFLTAQKQANIWHFGNGQSLDFSSGVPVQTGGSLIQTYEGSTSYSDSLGKLLFYTNGGGREPLQSGQDGGHIWNRDNAVMHDMKGTEGGGFSSAQSAVAFEAPGKPGLYYVFTMDELEFSIGASPAVNAAQPQGRGLRYFTIDMGLNNGMGGVVLADQPVHIPAAEGLCAIRHANREDYWILINQDSTGIGIYSVTSSGVSFVSNYTVVGPNAGIIKASPNGAKVRIEEYLLDFDPGTGQLSNPLPLPNKAEYFEFSPNSRYLFALSQNAGNVSVLKYDLQATSIVSSLSVVGTINTGFGAGLGQMQLGPDGKVYFLEPDFGGTIRLHRINCPNTSAAAIQQNIASFSDLFIGLPNFPAWLFEGEDSTYVELGADTVDLCQVGDVYTLDALNPGAAYLWSNGATTQTITVSEPGVYAVTVTGPCGTGTDQVVVVRCDSTLCRVFLPIGSSQQWAVPAGVDSVRVKMWGAAGGGGPDAVNNAGGGGGYTEFIVPVAEGDVFEIQVGIGGQAANLQVGGAGGYGGGGNGGSGNRVEIIGGASANVGGAGGGGGMSLVRLQGSLNAILGIAGGGGGGAFNRNGGGGGGLEAEFTAASNPFSFSGFGGSQTGPGAPSSNAICPHPVQGSAGAGQQGGTGATDFGGAADRTGGGGGGGGYFGGGGGGSQDACFGAGSAGGGGSGFLCNNCPGLTGFTQKAGFSGTPANAVDPLLDTYAGTATGSPNQAGGGGLVQICPVFGCTTTDSIQVTACNSYTDPLGTVLTQSGQYAFTLPSFSGCDSIIVLDLTIVTFVPGDSIAATACNSYIAPWGTVYTQSGLYFETLTAVGGCDSIVSLNLLIDEGSKDTLLQTTCDPDETGEVTVNYPNANGCDSLVTIVTIFDAVEPVALEATICQGEAYAFNGSNYTGSGIYTDTLISAGGCDSIVTIELTVLDTQVYIQEFIYCEGDSFLVGNTYYTAPGMFRNVITALNGCDSILLTKIAAGESSFCDSLNFSIYIPNVFSPNTDGINDYFRPYSPVAEFTELWIYQRWGGSVYEGFTVRGDNLEWDGTLHGKPLDPGVFVYTVKGIGRNGRAFMRQGEITLVR